MQALLFEIKNCTSEKELLTLLETYPDAYLKSFLITIERKLQDLLFR